MENKHITLTLSTHDNAIPLRFSFSWKSIFISLVTLLFSLGVLITFFIDYSSLFIDSLEKKRLLIENGVLKQQLGLVEGKLSALEFNLEKAKSFITKLKVITNIDDPQRTLQMGQTNVESVPDSASFDQPSEEPLSQEHLLPSSHLNQKENFTQIESASNRDYSTLSIRIDRAIDETHLSEQSMSDLWQLLSERQALLSSTPSLRPAQGWTSSLFGYRPNPFTGKTVLHAGLDIASNVGTPIIAPADGVIINATYEEGYGKVLEIDHGYGVTTRYAHCSQIFARVGQAVKRFDVVASVGNTGRSTGPHLHYEVRVGGIPRNPLLYILDE